LHGDCLLHGPAIQAGKYKSASPADILITELHSQLRHLCTKKSCSQPGKIILAAPYHCGDLLLTDCFRRSVSSNLLELIPLIIAALALIIANYRAQPLPHCKLSFKTNALWAVIMATTYHHFGQTVTDFTILRFLLKKKFQSFQKSNKRKCGSSQSNVSAGERQQ